MVMWSIIWLSLGYLREEGQSHGTAKPLRSQAPGTSFAQAYMYIVKRAFVLVSTSDGPDLQKTGTAQNLANENSKCQ